MKNLVLIFSFFSFLGYSQDSTVYLPSLNKLSIKTDFVFEPIIIPYQSNKLFTLYNRELDVELNYLDNRSLYYVSGFSKSSQINTHTRNRADSLNPSGSNNIYSAIATGIIKGLILRN